MMDEYRGGKLGKITLELPEDIDVMLEKKAAAADAAREALEKKVSGGGLTPEALALAEEALNLL